MKIEHIVLPEPGRSLLKKTHAILARQFPDGNREPGFVVGGGTMLAARWKHRSSRDIDVRVSNKAGHQLLSRMLDEPKLQTRLNWSMDRAGAVHRRRLDRHQLIYFFEPMAVHAARVDLTQGNEIIEGEIRRSNAEGIEFWSATNTAILAGKWKWRRHLLEIKDVFDLAVAGMNDGRALQRALGVETRASDLNEIVTRLQESQGALRKEAEHEIEGVPENLWSVQADPARHCARAIGDWCAQAVEVTRDGTRWHVAATCGAQPQGTEHGVYEAVEQAAARAGALAGLTGEEVDAMSAEAHREGGARRVCAGNALTATTGPEMRVQANGSVSIRDFGRSPIEAPDIENAARIAVELGWERSTRKEALVAKLREMKAEAMARTAEQGKTHTD